MSELLTMTPTHYCVACAARWVQHEDQSWSLLTAECGPCCNNVAMDAAPLVEYLPDGTIDGREFERVQRAHHNAERRKLVDRYRGIICAICDKPFENHADNWACPHPVRPRFKFPATPSERDESNEIADELVKRALHAHQRQIDTIAVFKLALTKIAEMPAVLVEDGKLPDLSTLPCQHIARTALADQGKGDV